MTQKNTVAPPAKGITQVFKPFANRTVEEEIRQVEILLEQVADEESVQAYQDLLRILQEELRVAESVAGRAYYEATPAGHLRITSDVISLPTKSVVREPVLQNLFPLLPESEYEDLRQSVMNHGLLNPLLITQDDKLICGYNRLRVCEDLGLAKVPVRRRYCASPDHAKAIAIADNLIRRHFSPSESIRTIKALELIGPISLPELAQKMGLSVRVVKRLKSVGDALIPEFKSLIDAENIPIRKAELIAGLPREYQEQILEIFRATKKVPEDTMLQDMKAHLDEKDAKLKQKEEEVEELQTLLDKRDKTLAARGQEIHELRILQSETQKALQETRKDLHNKKVEEQNYIDKLKRIHKDDTPAADTSNQDAFLERMFDTAMYTVVNFKKLLLQARAKQAVTPEMDAEWVKKLTAAIAEFTKKP